MRINKKYLLALFFNVCYCIILLNIAVGILIVTTKQSIPYYASITLVALFFILELILFYSNIPSIGILILSIIFTVPLYIYKTKISKDEFKPTEVTKILKVNILKLSKTYIPCTKTKFGTDPELDTIFKFQL